MGNCCGFASASETRNNQGCGWCLKLHGFSFANETDGTAEAEASFGLDKWIRRRPFFS